MFRFATVVAVAATGALALGPQARAATDGRLLAASAVELTPVTTTVAPGDRLALSGRGFAVPRPSTCEVQWTGPASALQPCRIADHARGSLRLTAAEVSEGQYDVTVCAPRCEDAWAGRVSGALRVDARPEPPPPPTPTGTGLVPAPDPDPVIPILPRPDEGMPPAAPGSLDLPSAQPDRLVVRRALVTAPDAGLEMDPDPARTDSTVTVEAPGLPAVPQRCAVLWDGRALVDGRCDLDSQGNVAAELRVPRTDRPGVHEVAVCAPDCNRAAARSTAAVTVRPSGPVITPRPTSPSDRLVVVPDLVGLRLQEARALAEAAELQVRRVNGKGRVASQDPEVGDEVPVGTTVQLRLRTTEPRPALVIVPRLVGQTLEDARAALARRGLALRDAPTEGGVIVAHTPTEGAAVVRGTLVAVELAVAPLPPDRRWGALLALSAAALLTGVLASMARERWRRTGQTSVAPEVLVHHDDHPEVQMIASPGQHGPLVHLRTYTDVRPELRVEIRS